MASMIIPHTSILLNQIVRVKISRGARLEVQDLNEIIDLVNFGGKMIVYMLNIGFFEMGPNKI